MSKALDLRSPSFQWRASPADTARVPRAGDMIMIIIINRGKFSGMSELRRAIDGKRMHTMIYPSP